MFWIDAAILVTSFPVRLSRFHGISEPRSWPYRRASCLLMGFDMHFIISAMRISAAASHELDERDDR